MIIKNQIQEIIISQMGFIFPDSKEDVNFNGDLGMDSLDLVELTVLSEQAFNVAISDEEAVQTQTFLQLHELLSHKIRGENN